MTLYLKYRPQKIDELDLKNVREDLFSILKSKDIPHAFLFSGPKGTGKTSAARILAKIINCESPVVTKDGIEPCNKCASCISITKGNNIDITELDAASNRGIDDIRSLKEGVSFAPVNAKKKVYIIDEAHMLTLEAANAFLKTLEEPPSHVVFILATTNPEKLPETVISRLTRVDFSPAGDEDIRRQLSRVAAGEKIKITPDAIKIIAKKAEGSFRDAVKILENISFKTKDIKAEDIFEEKFENFFEILAKGNSKTALQFIENLAETGISMKLFTENLLEAIHRSLLAKNGIGEDALANFSEKELLRLSELLNNARKEVSPLIQLPVEIAIIKFMESSKDDLPLAAKEEVKPKEETKPRPEPESKKIAIGSLDDSVWLKLLQDIREKNVSIEALLRAARPLGYDGKILSLGVYYQFHKEHLEDTKNTKILEDICKGTLGVDSLKINFQLIEKPSVKKIETLVVNEVEPLTSTADKDIIDAAKEIFG